MSDSSRKSDESLADKVSRLLRLSTLTPGGYAPTAEVRSAFHAAVFCGDQALVLCGPSDDEASVKEASALSSSKAFKKLCAFSGRKGDITQGFISGKAIPWKSQEFAIVKSISGVVETGEGSGKLIALVLNDVEGTLTTLMCTTTEIARIFDPQVPDLV
jgi:hypothetical protein